jgi:hypothetical protein
MRLGAAGWPPSLAIGLGSAVAFLSHNAGELTLAEAWLPLGSALAISLALWAMARLALREAMRAGLLAAVASALFFSGGALVEAVPRTVVWIATVALLIVLGIWSSRRTEPLVALFRIVRGVALAFFASAVVIAGIEVAAARSWSIEQAESAPTATRSAAGSPDIYYLVLDGYGREDVLRDAGGFSNRGFVEGLESRGFYVADRAVSNYAVTQMTLASSLNMDYLPAILPDTEEYSRAQFRPLIESPRIVEELARRGYEYVHVDSGWGYTSDPGTADVVLRPSPGRYTLLEFLRTTLLERWVDGLAAADKREHVLRTFELLGELGEGERPRFVFAHMLVPHRPYVFGRDGDEVSSERWSTMAGRGDVNGMEPYIDQLVYTNELVEGLLDAIMRDRERPLVVLVQGDHGIRSRRPEDPDLPDETIVRERHAILSAYYFSQGVPDVLYPAISPVNSFRVVLNEALGGEYELLEDRCFYSDHLLDEDEPWGLIHEVTEVATED